MMRYTLLLLIFFVTQYAFAQTCTIVPTTTKVCLGNTVTFTVNVTGGTPTSYSWNFGDMNTSTLPVVIHKYNSIGTFIPTITVNLSGGGTCTATGPTITVLPLPLVNYVVTSPKTMCFKDNQLCIKDLSTPGPSNAPINKRIWQLNNGYLQIDNAPYSADICYNNTLDLFGYNYTMVLEITDTNGCVNRLEKVDSARLLPRILPISFTTNINLRCDSTPVTFINTSTLPLGQVKKFVWEFGDGKKDSTRWHNFIQYYTTPGTFNPRLFITDFNDCRDSFTFVGGAQHNAVFRTINIFKQYDQANPIHCFAGNNFQFSNNSPGVIKWSIIKDGKTIDSSNLGAYNYMFKNCGDYTIRLNVNYANCPFQLDSFVNILGPRAIIQTDTAKVINGIQCQIHDTTYYKNPVPYLSCHNRNTAMNWIWDFHDPFAPPCTTDTKKGINVNVNCNYSRDSFNVKHRYSNGREGCYRTSLYMIDSASGCRHTDTISLSLAPPDAGWDSTSSPIRRGLKWTGLECLNSPIEFDFRELLPSCGFERAWVNWDTSCGANWELMDTVSFDPLQLHTYSSTCDSSGRVTVGLILRNGRDASGNHCYDTAYYPFFYFIPKRTDFKYTKLTQCKPYDVRFVLNDTIQSNLDYVYWDFMNGVSIDTLDDTAWQYMVGASIIRSQRFSYPRPGPYQIFVGIKDVKGCFNGSFQFIGLGFDRDFGTMKEVMCVNERFQIFDQVRYFADGIDVNPINYWADPTRIAAGKELLWWDIGDGNGFVHTGPTPTVSYSKPGVYTIKLAIKDSLGCLDTLVKEDFITIVEPNAKAYTSTSLYFCAPQIVLFTDSSHFVDSLGNRITVPDLINEWRWNFGDNKPTGLLQNPAHNFTSNDTFNVQLIIKTLQGCYDTAYLPIELKGPIPRFEIVGDTIGCRPFTVKFDNTTARKLLNWVWYFGDSNNTLLSVLHDSDVTFTYNQPGIYKIRLLGIDTLFNPSTGNLVTCSSYFPDTNTNIPSRTVYVNPTPKMSLITTDSVCPNEDVLFYASGDTLYNQFIWDFGDATRDTTLMPDTANTHKYSASGVYTVTLIPNSTNVTLTCRDTIRKDIHVGDLTADFEIDESAAPQFTFKNKSTNAVRYEWFDKLNPVLGNNPFSTATDAAYRYSGDSISFNICLAAYSAEDCWDTICKSVYYLSEIKIPNVFTPGNGDNVNDAFDIEIVGFTQYDLKIYNRWGGLVFESKKDGTGNDGVNWNGKINNEGEDCAAGVYYYIFNYKLITRDKPKSVNGTITLIR